MDMAFSIFTVSVFMKVASRMAKSMVMEKRSSSCQVVKSPAQKKETGSKAIRADGVSRRKMLSSTKENSYKACSMEVAH